MALAFLLFVFFVVIMMIAFFVFPPTKWVDWFYKDELKHETGESGKPPKS